MMHLLFAPSLPSISGVPQILIFIGVLAIIWIAIRFILKLAFRVMALGCGLILLLGIILVGMRLLR